jgi:hypothetical protein
VRDEGGGILGSTASKDAAAWIERYRFAREALGISSDSLFVLEEEVYFKFLERVLELLKRPDWAEYDRFSLVKMHPESQASLIPRPWLDDFTEAYNVRLQSAVVEMAELLARWATANHRPGRAIHADDIISTSFFLAEEFRDIDFVSVLVACIADQTKGPKLPKVRVPLDLAVHCYKVSNSLRDVFQGPPFSVSQDGMLMPDPAAIKASIKPYLVLLMRNPLWKGKAATMALQKIRLWAHLGPAAREKKQGTSGLAIKLPALTRGEIQRLESLNVKQAAAALCIQERMVRTHFQKLRLDRTKAGRATINEKFWNEYNRKHGIPH